MPESSLNADERETVINATDADDVIRIWTAQQTYITKLRNNPNFTETKTGHYGTTAWAEFTVPADRWDPAGGVKWRRNLTDEQRQALSNRAKRTFRQNQVKTAQPQNQPVEPTPGVGSNPANPTSQHTD